MKGCSRCEGCEFWNGNICTDEAEYVNKTDGEACCHYHGSAIPKDEYDEHEEDYKLTTGKYKF